MTQGRLLAFRNDRLGARLISLVNALRLARAQDLPFAMYWPQTSGVGKEFNEPRELFDAAFVDAHFIDEDDWRRARPAAISVSKVRKAEELRSASEAGKDVLFDMAFGLTVLAGEDPQSVAVEAGEVFRTLPFAPALQDRLSAARAAVAGATAYHIRRGDLISDIRARNRCWPHKYVPEAFYSSHIGRTLGDGGRVVLFSDEAATIDRLCHAHPAARPIAELLDLAALSDGARDFLELFALASADLIIAPEQSAFSTTASVLGGIPKRDVLADMPEDVRAECHDELHRLFLKDPDALGDAGETGQTLPHILDHLVKTKRLEEASDLAHLATKRALPVSFMYPSAMDLALRAGKPKRARRIGREIDNTRVYHTKDLVKCRVLEAVAAAELGDSAGAARALMNAYWHDPVAGDLKRPFPMLLLTGALGPENGLPVSQDVLSLGGRSAHANNMDPQIWRLVHALVPDIDALPRRGCLEALIWDWGPLTGTNAVRRSAQLPVAQEFAQSLALAAVKPGASADLQSAHALILAHAKDPAAGVARLAALRAEHPQNPMVAFRLSRALWHQRDWAGASAMAEQAVELLDAPMLRLWAAHCHLHQPTRWEDARAHLVTAAEADLGWPGVPMVRADLERRMGDDKAALAACKDASRLAPLATKARLDQARLLIALERESEALEVLSTLREEQRLSPPAFALYADLLRQSGRMEEAREVLSEGLERRPEHPQLREVQAAL